MTCTTCFPEMVTGTPWKPTEFTPRRILSPEEIIRVICVFYDVSHHQITMRRRMQEVVVPRQMAMFFLKEKTTLSLKAIGNVMGGRDHTTVIHSIEVVMDRMATEETYRRNLHYLRHLLDKATWN